LADDIIVRMARLARLMNDHSGWPLWDEEGGTGPEHWPMLSTGLIDALQTWERYWDKNFDHRTRWRPNTHDWYVEVGRRLAEALQLELGPDWVVEAVLD
jgi:hypothetical protein